jgi:thymidine phosphorylase
VKPGPHVLPQETIRRKRDGVSLQPGEISEFVQGMARGDVSDAQCAAFAMAVCWRGMSTEECVALTLAMRDSGQCLDWQRERLPGPVVDKHSTGGVGDSVSLMLGPMLAACGCFVPMISGRGLGHTGGTLDKLESIPHYTAHPGLTRLRHVVREAGVAIISAGPRLAPADRRLYAVRDVTATVESVPLITASILSKKLAAGLEALVLDVKFGSGAFMREPAAAQALARSLVDVGTGAGLDTTALVTDMDQPLAPVAGNALELRLAIDYLTGRERPRRLDAVVLALGSVSLQQCGLAQDEPAARKLLEDALSSGAAAERLARMVTGLGGPPDLLEHPGRHLQTAELQWPVPLPPAAQAARMPYVQAIDTRSVGLVVLQLGGGRQRAGDRIDHSVGLSALAPVGARIEAGQPIAIVHAAHEGAAREAVQAVQQAYRFGDGPPPQRPVVAGCIEVETR